MGDYERVYLFEGRDGREIQLFPDGILPSAAYMVT